MIIFNNMMPKTIYKIIVNGPGAPPEGADLPNPPNNTPNPTSIPDIIFPANALPNNLVTIEPAIGIAILIK